jgi:hypothetical protein
MPNTEHSLPLVGKMPLMEIIKFVLPLEVVFAHFNLNSYA